MKYKMHPDNKALEIAEELSRLLANTACAEVLRDLRLMEYDLIKFGHEEALAHVTQLRLIMERLAPAYDLATYLIDDNLQEASIPRWCEYCGALGYVVLEKWEGYWPNGGLMECTNCDRVTMVTHRHNTTIGSAT